VKVGVDKHALQPRT